MIKHIVTWKLKEENKIDNAKKIKEILEALPSKISLIKKLEVGINENGGEYGVILITEFNSYEDLKNYDVHDEHQKVKAFIKTVVTDRVAVDYEF